MLWDTDGFNHPSLFPHWRLFLNHVFFQQYKELQRITHFFNLKSTWTIHQEASSDLRNITSSARLFLSLSIRWDVALLSRHCVNSARFTI